MASGEAKKTQRGADVKSSAAPAYRQGGEALPAARISTDPNRVLIGDRKRPANDAAVANLMVSMQDGVQLQPILIRPVAMDGDVVTYKLVLGLHRLLACRALGRKVDATVREMTDDQAELAEVDENLVRSALTPYDRAIFLAARHRLWAALNPDRVADNVANIATLTPTPKRGRPAKTDKVSEILGGAPATMGFRADTAAETGFSDKTIRNALLIARGLSPAVHAKVSGSSLGRNEGLLRQIAGVADQAEQLRIVEALTDGRATKFADAQVFATGKTPVKAPETPVDAFLKFIQKVWKAAPKTHRDAFLHWLSGQALPTGWTLTKGDADA